MLLQNVFPIYLVVKDDGELRPYILNPILKVL